MNYEVYFYYNIKRIYGCFNSFLIVDRLVVLGSRLRWIKDCKLRYGIRDCRFF